MWMWILIALNVVTNVHGFASRPFPDACDSMLPQHLRNGVLIEAQKGEPPFDTSYELGKEGEPIRVSLKSKTSVPLMGFMLEAREQGRAEEGTRVGRFILLDAVNTQLLTCAGSPGSAVIQTNNLPKFDVKANWTAQGEKLTITFRTTFLQRFGIFWEPVNMNVLITPPTPTTTASTSEPSGTSGTVKPGATASTGTTNPSTTASTSEPSGTSITANPGTTASTLQPSGTSSTANPGTTASTSEPSGTSGTANPGTTASTGTTNPSTTASTSEPSGTSITANPGTTASTSEPSGTSGTANPGTTASTSEPSGTSGTVKPGTTASTGTTNPSTTASTLQPSNTSSTANPGTTVSTTNPSTTASTLQPSSTSSTANPGTTSSITNPSTIARNTTLLLPESTVSASSPVSVISVSDLQPSKDMMAAAMTTMTFDSLGVVLAMELCNIFSAITSFPHELNKGIKITCAVLCAAVEISALVLCCVGDFNKAVLVPLVVMTMVINFIDLIIESLPLGSKLQSKADVAAKVCSVIHELFTIAVMFVAVWDTDHCRKNENESWLVTVMAVYTAWIFLFMIWVFVFNQTELWRKVNLTVNPEKQSEKKKKLCTAAKAFSAILIVGTIAFNVAIIYGIFGCPKK